MGGHLKSHALQQFCVTSEFGGYFENGSKRKCHLISLLGNISRISKLKFGDIYIAKIGPGTSEFLESS